MCLRGRQLGWGARKRRRTERKRDRESIGVIQAVAMESGAACTRLLCRCGSGPSRAEPSQRADEDLWPAK